MRIIGRILLAAIAYVVGLVLSGMITAMMHLPTASLPPGTTQAQLLRNMLLAAPLLTAALLPLASGLKGKWHKRSISLAFLLFIALGLNTIIEARVFTGMISNPVTMALHYVLPALLVAMVLTWPAAETQSAPMTSVSFTPAAWTWRLIVAWLAFPVIYFIFGMSITPIIMPYYKAGIAGLKIPSAQVVVATQLVRSALFLLASLPLLTLWRKSRGGLMVAMGLAHAVTVGVFALVQASWLPSVLRVTHTVEITADSFVYAIVLVLLFVPKGEAPQAKLASATSA